jgi:hypothetical protein
VRSRVPNGFQIQMLRIVPDRLEVHVIHATQASSYGVRISERGPPQQQLFLQGQSVETRKHPIALCLTTCRAVHSLAQHLSSHRVANQSFSWQQRCCIHLTLSRPPRYQVAGHNQEWSLSYPSKTEYVASFYRLHCALQPASLA